MVCDGRSRLFKHLSLKIVKLPSYQCFPIDGPSNHYLIMTTLTGFLFLSFFVSYHSSLISAGTSSYPFIALPGGFGSTRYSPLGPFITHANQTSIEFCCSTPSTTKPSSSQISLPFVKPFYLMPVNSKTCQPVKNTEVRLDWIQWPHLEHEGGLHPYIERGPFGNGTVFYMCYYIPNGELHGLGFEQAT